jgi:hypothetical protein
LRTRARQDPPADVPAAADALPPSEPAILPAAGDLGLPAPTRLALTAGWNLAESLGLPLIAYAVGEQLGGQGLGMAAAAAMVWLTAAVRKMLAGSIPGLLVISGLAKGRSRPVFAAHGRDLCVGPTPSGGALTCSVWQLPGWPSR